MGNSIKPILERAEKTGVCSLSDKGLKEIPSQLAPLAKNLRTLDLSNNRIQILQPMIGTFTQLKSLTLANNRLESIPLEVGQLKKLETLVLDFNRLTEIPADVIAKLTNLKSLSATNNRLQKIPQEVSALKNLDAVDLSSNAITTLPEDLSQLSVVELNLNKNQISTLPQSLAQSKRLKVLRIQENCLSVDAFCVEILRDSQISSLDAEGNLFDIKELRDRDGYDKYMERYTATKKKFV